MKEVVVVTAEATAAAPAEAAAAAAVVVAVVVVVVMTLEGQFELQSRCAENSLQQIRSSGKATMECRSGGKHLVLITCNMRSASW